VRNLSPHYGVDTILRAFALLRARRPEATLTVAGTGSQAGTLRRLAATLGEDGIRFVGRVEPEHMPGLLDGADILVNASLVDNQPVTLLESFAAGLPVVSTPTGDIAALLRDGETGRLVPPRDPAALARAVDDLLAEPAAAAEIALRAHREVRRHTWAHVRQAWRDLYAQAARGEERVA